MVSGNEALRPRLDEDHGTSIRVEIDVECQIDGCRRQPDTKISGYVHFTMDGETYSRDSMRLCEGHREKLGRIMEET